MSRFDGKNLQLYRARNLLFACEIFLVHKSWSINQRVVIPVNLISVDRESEKVAPPRRFLDRSSVAFYLFFFLSSLPSPLRHAHIQTPTRFARLLFVSRLREREVEKRPHATKRAETRKPASGELLLLYRFVFALFALATVREKSWDVTSGYVELFLEWRMELTY